MSQLRSFVLVTGMTGAGRGTAAKVLENLGYYVIDNIPPQLLAEALRVLDAPAVSTDGSDLSVGSLDRVAVVIDARSRMFFKDLATELQALRRAGYTWRTLFLEASDSALVRRQDAARRPHPLSSEGRLQDGFDSEREQLQALRAGSDIVIDTTDLSVPQLTRRVRAAFEDSSIDGLRATVVTFGFKFGIPLDVNLVADLRFLPNPYWIEDLRPQSGLDQAVSDFVLQQDRAIEFLDQYENLVSLLTGGFEHEDKHFLTVGFGCTGGRHRSVAMAEQFADRLRARGVKTLVVHRDLGRDNRPSDLGRDNRPSDLGRDNRPSDLGRDGKLNVDADADNRDSAGG